MEKPNQEWITENIDLIMRIVLKINPDRKSNSPKDRTWRSEKRAKFKESMDSPSARPYYYLAKHKREEDRLFKIIKQEREENKTMKTALNAWTSNYNRAKKNIIKEFGEKSYEYQVAFVSASFRTPVAKSSF